MMVIKVTNAYENNLKNISVKIPRNKITAVVGVSGSGKSTLIYNVLANEAKRREKIDSGNSNCLDFSIRSKFKKITNLPYCVTLKQRGLSQSISSTVATITSLYEFLRNEFVKYGDIVTDDGRVIVAPTPHEIKSFIKKYYPEIIFDCFAVFCKEKYTNGILELKYLKNEGYKYAIFISSYDNIRRERKISSVKSLDNKYEHTILLPFDGVECIDSYENVALGSFILEYKNVAFNFGLDYFDILTGDIYQKKSTELLSFNSSASIGGRCSACSGHGIIDGIDSDLLFSKAHALNNRFLNLEVNMKGCYKYILLCEDTIQKVLNKSAIDSGFTYFELPQKDRLVINNLVFPKILKHKGRPSIGQYVKRMVCPLCSGTRLNYKANAVKLFDVSISDILKYSVDDLYDFISNNSLSHKKIMSILSALKNATLGYLPLDRSTDTLSGGELQRLKFSIELNSDYNNLLYIFDEPSSGLHPYNNHQMIQLINDLKNKKNTILISEHNPLYINNSDHIIELGPKSGAEGGEVIFEGKVKNKILGSSFSRKILVGSSTHVLKLSGVSANNIQNENFIIPLYSLVCIAGVSGSGKSSLVHKVLVPSIKQYIADKTYDTDLVKKAVGFYRVKSVVELTQSQIGLNTRSIVATYLNIFNNIRNLYSSLKISKEFGFDKGFFSFNSDLGACLSCKGLGVLNNTVCPSCLGDRYKPEVLDISYKDKNIADVLESSISDLSIFFEDKKLLLAFSILNKLGLSHLTLGRVTPTLSGGEAQRLRLAKVFIESFDKVSKGGFLFVLDEPTTGLNSKNINQILLILDEIIAFGNSVVVIEHNLDFIRHCDYIIDMGVGSGDGGGENIFSGTFKELLKNTVSLTAKALNGGFQKTTKLKVDKVGLKEKIYSNRGLPDCNGFYLDGGHFLIEKNFCEKFVIKEGGDDNFVYFRCKGDLLDFVNNLNSPDFSFNPFVSELYKFKVVPKSIRSEKIKNMENLGFHMRSLKNFSDWDIRVPARDIEQAYNYGNGWVTVTVGDKIKYELSTRLVSMDNHIIGSSRIDERTFNLYFNGCSYCKGSGHLAAYDIRLIIKDESLSISDAGFFDFNLSLKLKGVINKFKKEELFDFSQPFSALTKLEKSIFLFGFYEYEFLKPKGRPNAIGDYIRWKGLYAYIYNELDKIESACANSIKESKFREKCPFCTNGFSNEVGYYFHEGLTMIDIVSKFLSDSRE